MWILINESKTQNKTAEIFTSSIQDRIAHGSSDGVLTFKDLYSSKDITKAEYDSMLGWSAGYTKVAAWSEYIGPVVGARSTYIAGQKGLLNQGINNKKEVDTISNKNEISLVKDPVTGRMIEPNKSRVNIANGSTAYTPLKNNGNPSDAGWKHVVQGHFDKELANNRSIFTRSQEEIKSILQSKVVVNSPIK